MHATDVVDAEYVPWGQLVHIIVPVLAAYVPAGHGKHAVAADAEYNPVAHLAHTDKATAPVAAEYVPAGQGVPEDAPEIDVKYPPMLVLQLSAPEDE